MDQGVKIYVLRAWVHGRGRAGGRDSLGDALKAEGLVGVVVRLANGHSSVFVEDKTLIFGSKVIFVGYNAARGNLVSQSPALPHRAPRHSPHTFLEAA